MLKKDDELINKKLKSKKFKTKIVKVDMKKFDKFLKKNKNNYFLVNQIKKIYLLL